MNREERALDALIFMALSEGEERMEPKLREVCDGLRDQIKYLEMGTHALMSHSVFDGEQTSGGQHDEMRTNIMLAYRHLEDARMRIGKVIQAHDGGVSCYDK